MAGSKSKTPQTLTLIAAAMSKAVRKGAILPQLMATVRKDNPKIIEAESDLLIDFAMLTLARQHGNLRAGSSSNIQIDFFDEYPMGECVTIPITTEDGIPQSMLVRADQITLDQGRTYVESHKQRPKRSKRLLAMERAIKDLSPYGTGDSTFAECWKAKASKGKRPASS